jgi:hypothetical protein
MVSNLKISLSLINQLLQINILSYLHIEILPFKNQLIIYFILAINC